MTKKTKIVGQLAKDLTSTKYSYHPRDCRQVSNVYNLCKDSRILRSVGEYQNFRNYFKNYAREKS